MVKGTANSTEDLLETNLSFNAQRKETKGNAATGASAAGARAFSAQLVSFYFRAPVKAFFRTRVE